MISFVTLSRVYCISKWSVLPHNRDNLFRWPPALYLNRPNRLSITLPFTFDVKPSIVSLIKSQVCHAKKVSLLGFPPMCMHMHNNVMWGEGREWVSIQYVHMYEIRWALNRINIQPHIPCSMHSSHDDVKNDCMLVKGSPSLLNTLSLDNQRSCSMLPGIALCVHHLTWAITLSC